ncbi:MAG: hypothetical protein ACI81R_000334 [Bradymonadia bacterium]|jgi:hypothetical protein
MVNRTLLLPLLSAVLLVVCSACSADSAAGACDSAGDCPRGESCQESGTCGEIPCSDGCLTTEPFVEACLQEDDDGNFDSTVSGDCTEEECARDRDCESGEVCRDGVCYAGDSGPLVCVCREDCFGGEVCIAGACGAPLAFCNTDCECPFGTLCGATGSCEPVTVDACLGITCSEGETCEEGVCQPIATGCDPACGVNERCNPETLVCEPTVDGLCQPCAADDDCGGAADACVTVDGASVCGRGCGGTDECPGGYACRPVPGAPSNQCVPLGGVCGGCLLEGCAVGEYCDPFELGCLGLVDTCGDCLTGAACGTGASCLTLAGARSCFDQCEDGGACSEGFVCTEFPAQTTFACAPAAGSCSGGDPCGDSPPCPDSAPFRNPATCGCLECLTEADCPGSQTCSDVGLCVVAGSPCGSAADCPGGYCQGGVCVDCLTPADCTGGDLCVAGICEGCDCPAGQSCDIAGNCVDVTDTSDCGSVNECSDAAGSLGYGPADYGCDGDAGCFVRGLCNGSLLDGGLDLGGLLPSGDSDPFDAPCPAGTTCEVQLDILGGNFFSFACVGCSLGDNSTCREGEFCVAPGLLSLDGEPVCSATDGGGFPFPLPFP